MAGGKKGKSIILGGFKENSDDKLQTQKKGGIVSEATHSPSVEFNQDQFIELKLYLLKNNITMKRFFVLCFERVRANEIKLPLPADTFDRQDKIVKKAFKIENSLYQEVKVWLIKNNLSLRQLLNYCVNEFIKTEKLKESQQN